MEKGCLDKINHLSGPIDHFGWIMVGCVDCGWDICLVGFNIGNIFKANVGSFSV